TVFADSSTIHLDFHMGNTATPKAPMRPLNTLMYFSGAGNRNGFQPSSVSYNLMVRVLLGPCSFLVFSVICTQAAEIKQNVISSVEIRGAPAAIPFETKSGEVLDAAKLQRDVKA